MKKIIIMITILIILTGCIPRTTWNCLRLKALDYCETQNETFFNLNKGAVIPNRRMSTDPTFYCMDNDLRKISMKHELKFTPEELINCGLVPNDNP